MRVLLVEDSPTDALLARETLAHAGVPAVVTVPRLAQALEELATSTFDVVLLDLGLPDADGLETLLAVRARFPATAVVVLTSSNDAAFALRVIEAGAQDYLVKSEMGTAHVARAIRYALGRGRADAAVAENRARLESIVATATDAFVSVDEARRITLFNPAAERMFGIPSEEALGETLSRFVEERGAGDANDALGGAPGSVTSLRGRRASGETFPIEATFSRSSVGGSALVTGILRDVSDRERLDRALVEKVDLSAVSAAVGVAVSGSLPIHAMLQQCAEALVEHLGAALARIWIVAERGDVLELQASAGLYTHLDGPHGRVRVGQWKIGRIASERRPHLTNQLATDTEVSDPAWVARQGLVAFAGYPLVFDDRLVGVIAAFGVQHFSPAVLDAMSSVGRHLAVAVVRARSEAALRESEACLRQIAENVADIVILGSADGRRAFYVSPGYERLSGQSCEQILRDPMSFFETVHPDDRARLMQEHAQMPAERSADFRLVQPSGAIRLIAGRSILIDDGRGGADRLVLVLRDVTEQRQLEDQFRQAQKMESIGVLAGGVAHDFNNILAVILANAEFLLVQLPGDSADRELLTEIKDAADRAAALTRQLLAFSRKQVLQPRALNLNAVIANTGRMLQRILGEDVHLELALEPSLSHVVVDSGQIEQVLFNLVINARQAMPRGGRLTIETSHVEVGNHHGAPGGRERQGPHVQLSVIDTGCGMDAATMARIFEPFFTTKGLHEGTGLGLATVHGIVEQSGGFIRVCSEVDAGSRFDVLLPAVASRTTEEAPSPEDTPLPRGAETVLVVEDEPVVRTVARRILAGLGYTVIEASSGADALRLVGEAECRVDLLITDVVMPGMSGGELARELPRHCPEVKVLFVSGYIDDAVVRHGVSDASVAFLQKPYSRRTLAAKVREVLDAKPSQPGGGSLPLGQ